MLAAVKGHTEIVLALIATNADVHAKNNVSELWVRSVREGGCVCVLCLCVVTLCAPCASSA